MTTPVYLFGAGVQAQAFADLLAWKFEGQYTLAGAFDDHKPRGEALPGFAAEVRGTLGDGELILESGEGLALIAMGTKAWEKGWECFKRLQRSGVNFAQLLPAGNPVSPSATLGAHSVLFPGVYVGASTCLGDMVVIHGGSALEHHVQVGSHVLIGPGVSVASGVTVEDHVLLGAGCTIAPGVTIGRGALIGAGATVLHDVPNDCVCYGLPAKPIRNRSDGDTF